jgi:hypothetical protein
MSAVCAILKAHGVDAVFLTDDWFVRGATEEECRRHLDKAVDILQRLGWKLQRSKITEPSQIMPFLGILINTLLCRLSIPPNKLQQYHRAGAHVLAEDEAGRLTLKDLESLLGKLSWVSEVMVAGRIRLRRIRACAPGGGHYHPPPNTKVQLSDEAKADIAWWMTQLMDAATHQRWVPFWTQQPPVHCSIYSDAAGDVGYGLVVGDQVLQGLWTPEVLGNSSGFKELVPVLLALELLPEEAHGRVVIITTDNLSNVFAINKGSCHSEASFELLARIMELAAEKQIYLIADWVPRDSNKFCDTVSREIWAMI